MGVVVNRIRRWPEGEPPLPGAGEREAWRAELARAFGARYGASFPSERAAEAALAVLDGYAAAVARDAQATAPLLDEASLRGCFVRRIPELPRDVHDLDGLAGIAGRLFDEAQENP
jgi:hypothetical protein